MELDDYIIMRKMKDRCNIGFTVYVNGFVTGRDDVEGKGFSLYDYELALIKQIIWNDYWNLYNYDNDDEENFPTLFINLKRNKITGGDARLVKIDNWEFEKKVIAILRTAKERELKISE